jgi:hypothetical protein
MNAPILSRSVSGKEPSSFLEPEQPETQPAKSSRINPAAYMQKSLEYL